jgi:phosphate transport system protein
MSDHTSKQFDAEMEAIRSGVLTMGGLVERQLARAIGALEQDEEGTLLDAVGADEQQINQFQIDLGDDDNDHFIDPDEHLRIAMVRQ